VVEKAFSNIKERLNGNRLLVSSEDALEGKLFVYFIGLFLLSYIKKQMQEHAMFSKYTMSSLLDELDVLCTKVSSLVMHAVPVVVFCSTVNVILNAHVEVLSSAGELISALITGVAALLLLYCLILVVVVRLSPVPFLRKYVPVMKSIFLKGSGVAAIPINMRVSRRQLGVPQSLCSFSIPLGATINMDGNCMCLTVISLFFARICGVTFGTNEIIVLLLLVVILSLGAPIAPGTLILCLVTLLTQMGIDVSVISLVIGINFILEMLLGMVNSVGDVVVTLMVAKREGILDLDTYRRR
jgi:Na+/H+-dicarboxylate symporter